MRRVPLAEESGDTVELKDGLMKTVLQEGSGVHPVDGHLVTVEYHGTLAEDPSVVFDTTRGRRPFQFHLESMEVIRGWDIGVKSMTIGEKAILHIPHHFAYGDSPTGLIPPRSDLVFEITLLDSRDDTLSKIKCQLISLLVIILLMVLVVPRLKDSNNPFVTHYGPP